MQVAIDGDAVLLDQLAGQSLDAPPPDPIATLPERVSRCELGPIPPIADTAPWFLPIAIGDAHLAPCGLVLHPGEHALVSGPARSGRTTALDAIAGAGHAAGATVIRVDGRSLDPIALLTDVMQHADRPVLVLVDDADRVTDEAAVLGSFVRASRPDLHVVAAGRADRLRAHYGDWIGAIRESGVGIALRPDLDLDGDLFGVRLPRRTDAGGISGRGYLIVDGLPELVQVAGA